MHCQAMDGAVTRGPRRRAGRRAGAVALATAVALSAALVESASADRFVPPRGKMYHGVSDTGNVADFHNFRRQVKAHPAVLQEFFHWDVSLTASGAVDRWERTDTLGVLSTSTKAPADGRPDVEPRRIAEGRTDHYLLRINQILGNLERRPTYIRLFAEMNGHWNPYCAFNSNGTRRGDAYSTRNFKRAWKRFVLIVRGGGRDRINRRLRRNGMPRIYRANGPNDPVYERRDVPKLLDRPQVAFMWVPQTSGSPNVRGNQPRDYWPGRNFVDWVGADIYSAYQSQFPALVDFFHRYKGYPFVVGEYAPWNSDPGGAFTDRLLDFGEDHKRVRMLIYYRSVTADNPYYISHYPAARTELRRHLNKGIWDPFAPFQRD
jgi:hypothetical protein